MDSTSGGFHTGHKTNNFKSFAANPRFSGTRSPVDMDSYIISLYIHGVTETGVYSSIKIAMLIRRNG